MKVLLISTTTHDFKESASALLLMAVERMLRSVGAETRIIDANSLHIVENLSCYSSGGPNCASPDAGPYRCWAHHNSVSDPDLYGGVDEMPVIYDGINWADMVIFGTSTRWMSHSALMQKIIERMNTLENRVSVYGEASPLQGKRCGVVVTGQHYQSQKAADHLLEVFRLMGFTTSPNCQLVWQKTLDLLEEQSSDSNRPEVLKYLSKDTGVQRIQSFVSILLE